MNSGNFRKLFPYFENNNEITYLDNANTSQILGASLSDYVSYHYDNNYNLGRGQYKGAETAQSLFDWAKVAASSFIGGKPEGVIFTSGATSGLNLVAQSVCQDFYKSDKTKKRVILTTELEHSSALLPWMAFGRNMIEFRFIKLTDDYELTMENLKTALDEHRPDVLLLSSMTNTTGETRKLKEISEEIKNRELIFIVDHAQGAAHVEVNMEKLNIDYLVFSLHKMYGPKGVGVLYAKDPKTLSPMTFGGGMNKYFTKEGKFALEDDEKLLYAGTQNLSSIYASISVFEFFIQNWEEIQKRKQYLASYAHKLFEKIPNIKVYSKSFSPIVLFNLKNYDAVEISEALDKKNIYIRVGNHCAKLTKDLFGLSTCRMSLGIYNTEEEIIKTYRALKEIANETSISE